MTSVVLIEHSDSTEHDLAVELRILGPDTELVRQCQLISIAGTGYSNIDLEAARNVVITPHVAVYSAASMMKSRKISVSNIKHFLEGNHDKVRRYV